ncbi:MAG: hypothetical protein OEY63_04555 [Gemmatimonadota bacterium]|nr:hypothetical protein [Gemmatimonadota bacterium]MDH5806091.1 hypothetical protein [Gemmatimonadota bacterium]
MAQSAQAEKVLPVKDLLKKGLKDTKKTVAELAEAVHVPEEYLEDLLKGRRRPPLPGRTDIYEGMTSFLKLARNELANCATAERAQMENGASKAPPAPIKKKLLELCNPETRARLTKDRTKAGTAHLVDLLCRLLDVAQRTVRRKLNDQVALRIAAEQTGGTYIGMRFKLLEFLDVTPDTLTAKDLAEFVQPTISKWDIDEETGALRVVLRARESEPNHRRTPKVRPSF